MKELSASMGKLRHLRYLDFSYSKWIEAMPDSICKNCNLQTLRANNCYFLRELPYDMGNMIISLEKGCRIEELGCLKNLKGELTIKGLELVHNREEAQTAYLWEKPNINKLTYFWLHDEPEGCEINNEYVLDGLQPNSNLKTLKVENYFGTKFPSWFRKEFLHNLVVLKLSGCKRCKEIPSLGQLKYFRQLELIGFLLGSIYMKKV
ncbi:hypothetical protein P3L10_028531 [Capsicum annuum]